MTEDTKKNAVEGLDSTRRRIKFDERGNAVWKWQTENSDTAEESDLTFNMLKSLDIDSLEIEDSQVTKTIVPGTDPYNSSPKKKP